MRRALLLLLAVTCAQIGCSSDPSRGYTFASAYDKSIQTVATPVFDNRSYSYGLEALLTEAIAKEIARTTPWKITGDQAADTTLRGAITRVNRGKLGTDPDSGLVDELALVITVEFAWVDNRTGETLVARRNYRGAASFAPALPAQERIERGEQGAIETLAKSIVGEMRSRW